MITVFMKDGTVHEIPNVAAAEVEPEKIYPAMLTVKENQYSSRGTSAYVLSEVLGYEYSKDVEDEDDS